MLALSWSQLGRKMGASINRAIAEGVKARYAFETGV
jgi:hypothetical protein